MSEVKSHQDNLSQNWQKLDGRILGQILAAQNVVFALPDNTRIAEFYAQTLTTIPGISACRFCLGDMSVQAGEMSSDACGECESLRHRIYKNDTLLPSKSSFKCRLADQPDMRVIAIDSNQGFFGFMVLKTTQGTVGELYQPFIGNLSGFVTLVLENRRQKELLQKAHDELERKVEERTQELTAANKALAASQSAALKLMNEAVEARRRAEQFSVDLQRKVIEQKRAEQKLEKERALLRCIIDSASDLIFIKDQNSVYRSCNNASEAFIGMPESEQIGKTDLDFFDRKRAEEIQQADRQVIEEGKSLRVEEWVTGRDGRRLLMDTVKTPYYGPDGKPLGLVGISRDITERKLLEQDRLAHLRFLETMDRVNRTIQGADDLEKMMKDLLNVVLSALNCDQAVLVYPCDPETSTWSAPMERTRPEYPGILEPGRQMPLDRHIAETFRILLSADGPVRFDSQSEYPLPQYGAEKLYSFKSFLGMAICPKVGKPWQLGIHQCSHARVWKPEELRLLKEIGRRLEDALTSTLMHRTLRDSEERYRMVFENSPVSIWEEDFSRVKDFFDQLRKEGVIDIENYFAQHPEKVRRCAELAKVIDVNQAALTLHAAADKEELLANITSTFTPESYNTFRQELICLWNGCIKMSTDAVVRTLTNDIRNVTISFCVCPGYEKTLSKVLVSLIDITERKRVEQALSSSETELRTLIEAMTDIIIVGNSEGRYLKIVDTSPSLFYKPPIELLGKTIHEVFHKDQADFFLGHIRQALNTQASVNFEYSLPIGNKELWFNATISPMSDDTFVMVARDITGRKQSEEKLAMYREHLEELVRERTAQLEAANKELEAFSYSVSHDLHAPLRHIHGFIELLPKKAGAMLDEQSLEYMSFISDAAERMGRMIDELLSFSRMGRQAMLLQSVDLGNLVHSVIRELEPDTAGRCIEWCIDDLPAVDGDAAMLRMVMANLISNALKFTRPRQRAQIEIGSLPGEASETVIFVRDNGVGFDMNYADRLFGVFQRLHCEEEFEGTGIGLASVSRIIARHGGRTWAQGELDHGAAFFFSLPCAPRGGGHASD